jgi:putative flavoprotein involved in K+ transport
LAAGYYLQQAGLHFLMLEASNELGGAWPHYYDSLSLNSTARYSSLPGLPFPGRPDRYPRRDEAVDYLRRYAAHFSLPVMTGTPVTRVERLAHFFQVTTANHGSYLARTVIAASGFFNQPVIPHLPGQGQYQGQLLHVSDYCRPEPFRGQRVIVVGGGNAAMQISAELSEVARVTLTTRHPLHYMPQRLLGQDIHFWLRLTSLDRTEWLDGQSMPIFDTGRFRKAVSLGRPAYRPLFDHFTTDGVVWADGREEKVDAVLFATGYQPYLTYLNGLAIRDEADRISQRQGVSTTVAGLYFVGLPRQRTTASATLRGVGADAKIVVKHLHHYCQTQQALARPVMVNPIRQQTQLWRARGGESLALLNLMLLSLKEQTVSQGQLSPRLLGEALTYSVQVIEDAFGVGDAAEMYSSARR